MQKFLKPAMAPLVVAMLVLAVIAAPAGAHQTEVSQGNDFAITASDHESGTVCDMERDGHAVYADWYDESGNRIATASDGGDPGCDEVNFPGTSKAERVEVCEVWLEPTPDAKCSGRDNL
jgi:hypothetical protein